MGKRSVSERSALISRRQFLAAGVAAGAGMVLSSKLASLAAAPDKKLNVLFIAVDDLRPQLGCYGVTQMKTPNIDALARAGTLFERAYCQQAVCSPSRTSLLTGLRPDTTRVYDLQTHFRANIPDVVTLPQLFREHGYHTQSLGKVYHGDLDDPMSWSVPSWRSKLQAYSDPDTLLEMKTQTEAMAKRGDRLTPLVEKDPKTGKILKITAGKRAMGPPWEIADVPDDQMIDGDTADHAVEVLREIKDKPFFLAVGFIKPHLPFVAPKKYYDMYPASTLHEASNPEPPKDCPPMALAGSGELRAYVGVTKKGPIVGSEAIDLIHGYYASTSFVDAQIGKVVDELDRLGIRKNTVIVLWGDHGWQLGEHGEWCKHTNFEVATRSPLIISAPGQKNKGAKTNALSEFVDIYPTLCDLCDLPKPAELEGTSLAPVMKDPKRQWKQAAFSQYPRRGLMGHSMRSDRYRYTEWAAKGQEPEARELYDHRKDPDENVNIANLPENKKLVEQLSAELAKGWKAAVPGR